MLNSKSESDAFFSPAVVPVWFIVSISIAGGGGLLSSFFAEAKFLLKHHKLVRCF